MHVIYFIYCILQYLQCYFCNIYLFTVDINTFKIFFYFIYNYNNYIFFGMQFLLYSFSYLFIYVLYKCM